MLGIVVGIGLSVGLSVGFGIGSVWWGVLAGIASFALACFLIWEPHSRHYLMEFARWLTGQ